MRIRDLLLSMSVLASPSLRAAEPVTALALSPDGIHLATGGEGRTLRMLRTGAGDLVAERKLSGKIESLAFSADGRRLAAGASDRQVTWFHFDKANLAHPREFRCSGPVAALAFSPDGRLLACGLAGTGVIHLLDAARGAQRTWLDDSGNGNSGIAFAARGKVLVSAGQTWSAWDLEAAGALADRGDSPPSVPEGPVERNGKFRLRRLGMGWAMSVAALPDGKSCAAWEVVDRRDGPQEVGISIRDVRTGEETLRLGSGAKGLGWVALTDDGRLLASSDEKGRAVVWELPSGRERARYAPPGGARVSSLSGATTRPLLALAVGGVALLWDLSGDRQPEAFSPRGTGSGSSPSGGSAEAPRGGEGRAPGVETSRSGRQK